MYKRQLLREEPEWAERAARFSAKVRDASELIAEIEPRAPRGPIELRAVYHDPCHLAHGQGVREGPRRMLREIPGVELLEPADASTCCGSAGIYNIVNPETGDQLGGRKVKNLAATGAEVAVVGNAGCTLQIEAHARQAGLPLAALHPMEILARSIAAGAESGGGSSPTDETNQRKSESENGLRA